jgi:hypothetical protein
MRSHVTPHCIQRDDLLTGVVVLSAVAD